MTGFIRRSAVVILLSGLFLCAGCALTREMASDHQREKEFRQHQMALGNSSSPAPPGPDLKGKRVVVLTTVSPAVQAEFPGIDNDLNDRVVATLKKTKTTEIIPAEKVYAWIDSHPHWTDTEEIAKAFAADLVISLEVESFRLDQPENLKNLLGQARTHISVSETNYPVFKSKRLNMTMPEETTLVYVKDLDAIFPKEGCIDSELGVSRSSFKKNFVAVVAVELSEQFAEHRVEEDLQDVKSKK